MLQRFSNYTGDVLIQF